MKCVIETGNSGAVEFKYSLEPEWYHVPESSMHDPAQKFSILHYFIISGPSISQKKRLTSNQGQFSCTILRMTLLG